MVDAESFRYSGTVRLDDDVANFHELVNELASLDTLEIDDYASFAAIDHRKQSPMLSNKWREVTSRISDRRLDLDDLRSESSQKVRAVGTRQVTSEVEDTNSG